MTITNKKYNSLRNRKKKISHLKLIRLKIISYAIIIIFFSSLFSLNVGEVNNRGNSKDTDNDGYPDEFDFDDDNDGFSDTIELEAGTDPLNASDYPQETLEDNDGDYILDSKDLDDDNDGLSDSDEKKLGTNPKFPDTDMDNLFDYEEVKFNTDPLDIDSDNDNFNDGDEVYAGTDPLDGNKYPKNAIAVCGQDRIAYPNEHVLFDGSLSIGNIINYSWDFDASDGIQVDSEGGKVEHIYDVEGVYTVTLMVSDGETSDIDTFLMIVNQNLAAQMNIIRNRALNFISYESSVKLSLSHRDHNSVVIDVSGNLSSSAVVLFTIDSYTMMVFDDDEIIVKFDNRNIIESNIKELINSKGSDPLYNISIWKNELRIIVYIPHFSIHTIAVEKEEKLDDQSQDFIEESIQDYIILWAAIIIIFILSIIFILAYSYKKSEDMKYYNKLNFDDEEKINYLKFIENGTIDWEDYDSER